MLLNLFGAYFNFNYMYYIFEIYIYVKYYIFVKVIGNFKNLFDIYIFLVFKHFTD